METLPNDPVSLTNLGVDLAAEGNLDQAVMAYRKALERAPTLFQCRSNLGHALLAQGDWAGAAEAYRIAIAQGYNPVEGARLIGLAQSYLGHLEDALGHLSHQKAEFTKGTVLLAAGRLREGWPFFDRREHPWRPAPPPYWNGESLTGKTIFVWPEWTVGDALLFSSTLPDLIAKAGKVIIECKPTLYPIFKRSFPDATVMSQATDRQAIVPPENTDFQIPLSSLGQHLRPDFASFPKHNGYLKSDLNKVQEARARYEALAEGRKIVGLGWRSKNEITWGLKCARLIDWEPILKVPGIFFVNLLTGDWQTEVQEVADKLGVHVHRDDEILAGPEAVFTHVAAMDLAISTSNTVIHAAGTQGIPGWLILPQGIGAYWYWFNDREGSPWYPSLRLFRRARGLIGEKWWANPVARAGRELERF